MRRIVGLALCALATFGCGRPPVPFAVPATGEATAAGAEAPLVAPPPRDDRAAVPGEIVAKFREGTFSGDQPPELPNAEALRPVEGIPGAWVYRANGGRYTLATADALRGDTRLEYAEPNYRYQIIESEAEYTPPGEQMRNLWGLRKVAAPEAWDSARGKSSVLVAVIDTGVDYRHPDLAGIVVKGPDVSNGDHDPADDHGHGTHVAGTIAARNNGKGVVGVAFGVKILAIKALDENGSGPEDGIARAIDAAVKNGAKVINMSLGGPDDSRAMRDAVARATRKGVLCVVAAGNDGDTRANYPASYPDAFAVGATDPTDRRAYFSNHGKYVQIAAPGVGILSSSLRDGFEWLSGTSMAAPHVAGAAGLLLSARPSLTVSGLKRLLAEHGDAASGFSAGVRRLNVQRALGAASSEPDDPGGPDPGTGDPGPSDDITGISVKRTTGGAVIRWKTTQPALGFVEYGKTDEYGATTFYEDGYKTDHELALTGMKRWAWYHFRIHAKTQGGQSWISKDQSFLTKLWWLFSLEEREDS